MNILLVSYDKPSPSHLELFQALREDGHEVRLFVPEPALRDGLPSVTGADEFGARIRQALGTWKPDVVHALDALGGVAAHVASWRRIPVVQSLPRLATIERRSATGQHGGITRAVFLEWRLIRRAAVVMAGCTSQALDLFGMGVPSDRVRVSGPGINVRRYFVEPRRTEFTGPLRLLAISSSIDDESGVRDVVTALTRLPGAELVVAGGREEDAKAMLAAARKFHVAHRVSWLGPVHERGIRTVFSAADVVVRVPWRDWSGRSILEAMSANRPIVASATGALHDVVNDGVTGWVVPPREPMAIAAAVQRIATMPVEDRARVVRAGFESVTFQHSWRHRLPGLLDAYGLAVSRRAATRDHADMGVA